MIVSIPRLHAEILVKTRIFEMRRMELEAPLDHLFICPANGDGHLSNQVIRIADHSPSNGRVIINIGHLYCVCSKDS
jgi:hypothetical protein